MVFSSLTFLCVFLPVVYLLHLLSPSIRIKNGLLIVASLLFYAYGEPVYVLLMIASVTLNYAGARALAYSSKEKTKKAVLAGVVTVNIGLLCVFKYTGFLLDTIRGISGLKLPDPKIALPIGISFFTFQALSYVIDVYRGRVEVQENFFKVFLYISFFPQLIAGPIVKYRDIAREIDRRQVTASESALGMRRFIGGLGKKVLIANTMGAAADHIFSAGAGQIGWGVAWIGAIAYMFQIYYDFSGYSDMAIGLGRMFGFHFKENFLYPYSSANIREFWRRWHISLSSWFKEYVYIPLGGNRKGRMRTVCNKIIVFFLTGLWHGANWTFVVWGLFHGFFLLLEEYVPAIRKLPRIVGILYSCIVVCVGFVVFRANDMGQALFMIQKMFVIHPMTASAASFAARQMTPWFLFMLAAAVLGAGPVRILADRVRACQEEPEAGTGWRMLSLALYPAAVILLVWCMIRLSGNGYNPFIYFRF